MFLHLCINLFASLGKPESMKLLGKHLPTVFITIITNFNLNKNYSYNYPIFITIIFV